ncbi:hypothetical protein AXE80_07700 [Wenyingzhuangia fucanilytica]|uniref:Uncharacterized protein n=1 Tax=Wenyingzhuangia fucanilytica TaxID=1790137 RepID=A0A1B1Y5V9_9FLAO|nr:hypothetical protein [Wenyingzhuangia fucanilytica]ANW96166.1 hypothetical protein AXE80_07700 [Wenyingzhuangia fucanilytica]
MERKLNILIISILIITFYSCGSASHYVTKNSNRWAEFELRPSQIKYDGKIFYYSKLNDDTLFGISYDNKVNDDSYFYYNKMMLDFNWYKNSEGNWSGKSGDYFGNARRLKNGHLYVNPVRKVALYFEPKDGKFTAFKVTFK